MLVSVSRAELILQLPFSVVKNSEGTVEQNVQVGRKVDDEEYEDYDEDPDDELNECKYNPITKVATCSEIILI